MSRIGRLFQGFRRQRGVKSETTEDAAQPFDWLIVGLGNPGDKYRRSRHNAGFRVIDTIAKRAGFTPDRRKFSAEIGEGRWLDRRILLAKPQTYYNESGNAVASILNYYRLPPANLLIVNDEMDLDEGVIRLKLGGGDAGNRGVKSIIDALGDPEFARLRIGIGHPEVGDPIDYLLQAPGADVELRMERSITAAADAVAAVLECGMVRAMNKVNRRQT